MFKDKVQSIWLFQNDNKDNVSIRKPWEEIDRERDRIEQSFPTFLPFCKKNLIVAIPMEWILSILFSWHIFPFN